MQIFEYVLILLMAVLLSNVINRFLPVLSVPIVQIVLGILIALIPFGAFGFEFELEPELFFVLFLSPLVFHSSMMADKKILWQMKKPIIAAAVLLVFLTVIATGFFVHALIPTIPLAAAFALSASLAPTDAVAVNAVSKRVALPSNLMGILSGESIINDATGIVCFQLALAAASTGTFSISQAVSQFLLLGIGGILAGLILTWLKYIFVHWLRSLGMENSTLHILIGILTPFIIYMSSEALHVSGILAVFASGIAHSFKRERFNPQKASLNITEEGVWSVLSFSLDGLVFVVLGTQLPGILKTIGKGTYTIYEFKTVGCILLITLFSAVIRFLWGMLTVPHKSDQEESRSGGKIKSGLIFSLSGARGTVTLATIMSIPLLLPDGNLFPERELIILLASGVIVVSLLVTNFILPLFVEKKENGTRGESEKSAYTEIIQTVIGRLQSEATDETRMATELVTHNYYSRYAALNKTLYLQRAKDERALRQNIQMWEKENTEALKQKGVIDEATANQYLAMLNTRNKTSFAKQKLNYLRSFVWMYALRTKKIKREEMHLALLELTKSNEAFVLEKLYALKETDNNAVLERLISEQEMIMNLREIRMTQDKAEGNRAQNKELVLKITTRGFGIERELIQQMFETGRISWETARDLRNNINMLESQLHS